MLRIWIFLWLTLASGADPTIRVALTVQAHTIASRTYAAYMSTLCARPASCQRPLLRRLPAQPVAWLGSSGHEFRMAVGPRQLPSTRCKLLSGGESLTLAGSGWGHGVGLCQWGSYEMGQRGMTARQILSHYYPTCSLRDWAKRNQS
ncbi:hypothetical protein IV102_26635 [bacterium]|nr:hypothetical protein [bacterium]